LPQAVNEGIHQAISSPVRRVAVRSRRFHPHSAPLPSREWEQDDPSPLAGVGTAEWGRQCSPVCCRC
jgi:hypothetical protein